MTSNSVDTFEKEIENLSHEDLCEITQSSLRRLLASDPLLSDLPSDVTTEEVLSQIAVTQGQSITVTILRNLETPLSVVVIIINLIIIMRTKGQARLFSFMVCLFIISDTTTRNYCQRSKEGDTT